jgi:hypothetical protein
MFLHCIEMRTKCIARMRAMQIRSLAALFVLALVPVSCTAMSTYPPTAGHTVSTPNVTPGPEVMAGAIKEAHRLTAPNTKIVFNLPVGLAENTWNRVAGLLPDTARAMEPGDEGVYSVQQLRIGGGAAEVDVVYPDHGVYQLMTVKFSGGLLMDWRVEWAYRWMIPATKPVANDPLQRVADEQKAGDSTAGAAEIQPQSAPADSSK